MCFLSFVSIIIQCSSLSGKAEIDNQVSELLGHVLGQPKLLVLKLNTFFLFPFIP